MMPISLPVMSRYVGNIAHTLPVAGSDEEKPDGSAMTLLESSSAVTNT